MIRSSLVKKRVDTMARDGQDQFLTQNALLKDLIDQTGRSAEVVSVVLERAIETVRSKVSQDGRVSATLIELNQTAAHGLAWLATMSIIEADAEVG